MAKAKVSALRFSKSAPPPAALLPTDPTPDSPQENPVERLTDRPPSLQSRRPAATRGKENEDTTQHDDDQPRFPQPASWGFEQSSDIAHLATALGKFQAELRVIGWDADGYGYSYATLTTCLETCQPLLAKHGLVVTQWPISEGNRVGILSMLIHDKSGQYLRCGFTFGLPRIKGTNVTQQGGGAITYARRYAFLAILGLVADEDLDAN